VINIDFTKPVKRTNVNGFPIRFRKDRLSDECILWVPQRITRNLQSKGWRIIINHADGQLRMWEGDLGRSPLESLQAAWRNLYNQLMSLKTPITMERRRTLPGRKRNPAIDTGVDGVLIVRHKARNGRSKAISVRIIQRIADAKSVSRPVPVDTFHVSESKYIESPETSQMRFINGLCLASALRAHYLEEYAKGGPVLSAIRADNIDPGRASKKPAVALDLGNIFDSFN